MSHEALFGLRLKQVITSAVAVSFFFLNGASAQSDKKVYEPTIAQPGKDVIWVPTPNDLVVKMLETAKVNSNDLVYDLGAGDGKIPIQAARQFGARAVGIEFNPDMANLARQNAERAKVSDKVTIVTGDIFEEDFSNATVVTLYLLTSLNLKLKPTILNMKPGTRVVSNSFMMGSWEPDEIINPEAGGRGYYWVVPAKVQGDWSLTGLPGITKANLNLEQKFQKTEGTLIFGDNRSQRVSGKLNGSQLTLTYKDANDKTQTLVGEVAGKKINASLKDSPTTVITATKTQ
ncbi:methyltransferase domain-containing protein [Zwartia vadi]|uniref:methyltransferase domain-containing protein n=1 Tax=Zwartia vadi TaxID=3058168 RepID=UPI0025B427B2|nr:class I SAM-dependent methyltransferase [Zwartia vadi]MDN3987617.1 class I SAM-dependent methyltransferase [Zwartia vadi]